MNGMVNNVSNNPTLLRVLESNKGVFGIISVVFLIGVGFESLKAQIDRERLKREHNLELERIQREEQFRREKFARKQKLETERLLREEQLKSQKEKLDQFTLFNNTVFGAILNRDKTELSPLIHGENKEEHQKEY